MTNYEQNVLKRIEQLIVEGELTNDFMVANLQLLESYLSLQRVSTTAKLTGKSVFGIRKFRKIVKICNYQLTINND